VDVKYITKKVWNLIKEAAGVNKSNKIIAYNLEA